MYPVARPGLAVDVGNRAGQPLTIWQVSFAAGTKSKLPCELTASQARIPQVNVAMPLGFSRHSPEGVNFKHRSEVVGWKQAVKERDEGSFDWASNSPFDDSGRERKD